MRYFIELRYNGGAYCGWQRQPDMPSVQQTIEGAISTLLREPILLTGAGRTDTGVNSSYYVAHFDTSSPVADPEQVVFKTQPYASRRYRRKPYRAGRGRCPRPFQCPGAGVPLLYRTAQESLYTSRFLAILRPSGRGGDEPCGRRSDGV